MWPCDLIFLLWILKTAVLSSGLPIIFFLWLQVRSHSRIERIWSKLCINCIVHTRAATYRVVITSRPTGACIAFCPSASVMGGGGWRVEPPVFWPTPSYHVQMQHQSPIHHSPVTHLSLSHKLHNGCVKEIVCSTYSTLSTTNSTEHLAYLLTSVHLSVYIK